MQLSKTEFLKAAKIVSEEESISVCVKNCLGAAAFTGLTTFIGGLLMGPVGLAAGATIGGLSSAKYTNGKFKPLASVLDEITDFQKEVLAKHLQNALIGFLLNDFADLITHLHAKDNVYDCIADALKKFVMNDLKLELGPKGVSQ